MAYEPTHEAPAGGLPAWPTPDGTGAPAATLGAGLDVQVLERTGDWAHIECSNGWKAWVDGRRLVARAAPSAAPSAPSAPSAPASPVTPSPQPTPAAAPVTPSPEPTPAAAPVRPSPVGSSPVAPSPVGTPPARSSPVAPTPQPTGGTSFAPAPGAAAPAGSAYASASRPSPSAAPGAAPVAPVAPKRGSLGASGFLALIGGALMLLSTALAWVDLGRGENAFDTPASYIWDEEKFREALVVPDVDVGLPAAVVVIGFGVIALLAALVKRLRPLALVGGLGALAAAGLFLYQASSVADDPAAVGFGFADVAGPGPFLALLGGGVALAGGIVAWAQRK